MGVAYYLPFPLDARLRASSLPDDLQCAVRFIVTAAANGTSMEAQRLQWLGMAREDADILRPISRAINRLMPPSVFLISAEVNTAYMAALIIATEWLDWRLVERFVYGFMLVGDIPDSYVYRPIRPVDDATHLSRLSTFVDTAPDWNAQQLRRLERRRTATGELREADIAVAKKTQKEKDKGLIVGPYLSVGALHDAIARLFPHLPRAEMYPRVMDRFGVVQHGETRAIDNGRSNGANRASRLVETVTTPHFYFPAVVARAVYVAAQALGLRVMPGLTICLMDLSAAYRTIPAAQPWYTAFAFFNPLRRVPAPEYYWLPGHNFGLGSAVVNFNRYPEFITSMGRSLFALQLEHFYDDFLIVDSVGGGETARLSVDALVAMLGPGEPWSPGTPIKSPAIDPSKTKPTASTHTVLGVVADLAPLRGPTPFVWFHVDHERARDVLAEFREAFERGQMLPHLAARVRGRLFFLLCAAYANVGRAATLPLVQRQYRDTAFGFEPDSELHSCLLFFEALVPVLPGLAISVIPDTRRPLLVYTDASFYTKRKRRRSDGGECPADHWKSLRGGLGAVVIDPETSEAWFAAADPPWALLASSWQSDRKTYIAELETLAAISVYSTYPNLFVGRKVNHFIDNTVAQSALVHGYAKKPDLAKSVNVFTCR